MHGAIIVLDRADTALYQILPMLQEPVHIAAKFGKRLHPPTLSSCSERKNRLSSTECLTASRSFRGGVSNGTGSRRTSRSLRRDCFYDQRLRADCHDRHTSHAR